MTRMEHIQTLLEEDKEAIVGSYLSLLAFIEVHQRLGTDVEELMKDIAHTVHRHIEVLPMNSVPVFEELEQNEMKRLQALIEEE